MPHTVHTPFKPRLFSVGFSLVELLLVLGVLSILLVAMFVIYPQVRTRQLATIEAKQVLGTVNALATVVGPGGSYRGFNNLVINRVGMIPESWNNGNQNTSILTNRFGGTVQFIATAGGAGGCSSTYCRGLRVDFHNVPTEACQHMIPLFIGRFRWVWVRPVGSSTWTHIQSANTTYADPVGRAVAACASAETVVLLLAT